MVGFFLLVRTFLLPLASSQKENKTRVNRLNRERKKRIEKTKAETSFKCII